MRSKQKDKIERTIKKIDELATAAGIVPYSSVLDLLKAANEIIKKSKNAESKRLAENIDNLLAYSGLGDEEVAVLIREPQFEAIATLIRSRGPAKEAARLTLVHGMANIDAARSMNPEMSAQAVHNATTRYRKAYQLILSAFGAGG